MISLAGKAALITGGSRGIGAAAVKLFARAGADVVFSYKKSKDAAAQVEQEARKQGTRVDSLKGDMGNMKDVKKLVDFARERLGRIDILVANSGIWNEKDEPIEKMSEHEWDEMMRINLKSVYGAIHYTVPTMIHQKSGRIVAISSTAGQRGESFHTHYGASKGAIISLVKGLATELAPHNIHVNCVAPGWVDTDMSRPALDDPTTSEKVLRTIPLGRVGKPEEIAAPVLFLCTEHAGFISGEIFNVNGGAVLVG